MDEEKNETDPPAAPSSTTTNRNKYIISIKINLRNNNDIRRLNSFRRRHQWLVVASQQHCYNHHTKTSIFISILFFHFRNVLCKGRELGVKSIGVCIVSTVQKNFPPDIGAHIALSMKINYTVCPINSTLRAKICSPSFTRFAGTIRRFLDKFRNETIILCLETHERGIYEVLAPLYFPRDYLEESSALWQLPRDIGGTFGEPQIFDRQIRIIHNPQHCVMMNGE